MNYIDLIPHDVILINPVTRKGKLCIINNSASPIIFKLKTTNPKNYTVKPNLGVVESRSKLIIQIILQENISDIENHKFMIQIHNFKILPVDIKSFVRDPDNKPFINKKLNVNFEHLLNQNVKEESENIEIFVLLIILYQFILFIRKILF